MSPWLILLGQILVGAAVGAATCWFVQSSCEELTVEDLRDEFLGYRLKALKLFAHDAFDAEELDLVLDSIDEAWKATFPDEPGMEQSWEVPRELPRAEPQRLRFQGTQPVSLPAADHLRALTDEMAREEARMLEEQVVEALREGEDPWKAIYIENRPGHPPRVRRRGES